MIRPTAGVRRTITILGLSIGGYFLLRRLLSRRFISLFDPHADGSAVDFDNPFEDVKLQSMDGLLLDARWAPGRRSSKTVVLAPGRGGNKSSVYAVEAARGYLRAGLNVLMLSLRSQGESEGRFLSAGYREVNDIHGALRWLEDRGIEAKNVVLHGFSSGGAAVLRAAPGSGVGAVVEEGSYADLPLLLGNKVPWHKGPSSALCWITYLASKALDVDFDPWALRPKESAARLYEEGVPLLIIQSMSATQIPFQHAELIKEVHPDAWLWALEGYEHIGAYKHPDYQRRLLEFLEGATDISAESS